MEPDFVSKGGFEGNSWKMVRGFVTIFPFLIKEAGHILEDTPF